MSPNPPDVRVALPGLPARYRILRLLGEGAQKSVYLAEDSRLERPVAVAAIDTRTLGDPERERLAEARMMARIGDYPHLVAVHDVIETRDAVYAISQYVPGGDLATHLAGLAGRELPIRQAIRIATQVCRAIERAHDHGIAHLDLKPSNVFLDDRGDALLGDFGLARIAAATPTGEIVGTPAYMAPEQISGRAVGPLCDLYSLGCLLYELTTGTPPFTAESVAEILRLHSSVRPVAPRDRRRSIPPPLNDLILRLLEKNPNDRPASSRDVRAALEGMLRSVLPSASAEEGSRPARLAGWSGEPSPVEREPPLVGREREMIALEDAIAGALTGRPALLLLEGSAGIGKSRLLRELRSRAEAQDAVTLVGFGYEDVAFPYRPFVEALLPLASRLCELEPEDAELMRRFLHLGAALDEPRTVVPGDAQRHRLFVSVFRALAVLSRERPLVLVIDDLHWADSASVDLFEHLALGLAQHANERLPVVLVAGSRPLDPEDRLARMLGRCRREPLCRNLEIGGLDESGIHAMLTALTAGRPSNQLVHTVRQATGGNPLFVREILGHLERQRALSERRGFIVSSISAGALQVPASLAAAVAGRTHAVSAPCRQLLILGSFLGARFAPDLLARAAGQAPSEVLDLLDEAVAHRLLVDGGEAYEFAHPLIRQVLYQEIGATRRQRTHVRIAQQLEEIDGDDPEREISIALHLLRAGSSAEPGKVLHYAERAAAAAFRTFAWNEAAELLEAAILAAESRPNGSSVDLAELHLKAGLAYYYRLDTGPCLHHFDAAIERFRSAGDPAGLARALNWKARALVESGLVPHGEREHIRQLEQALDGLDRNDWKLRATVMGTLAESYWLAQEPGRAEELANAGLVLARTGGDDASCAQLYIDLASAQMQGLHLEEALDSYRAGIAHARRADDLLRLEKCLQRVPMALFMAGHLEEARRNAVEAGEINMIVQNPGDALLALSTLVALAVVRGDFETVEQRAREALEMSRRAAFPWPCAVALASLACSRAMRDDDSAARQAVDLLDRPGVVFEDPSPFEAHTRQYRRLLDVYAGRVPPLEAELADAPVCSAPEIDHLDVALLPSVCAHVEVCAAAGSPGLRPSVLRALDLAERHGVVFTLGWPFFVPRIQGLAAVLEGRWERAEVYLRRAGSMAEERDVPSEVARCRLDLARLLVARGRTQDRRVAAGLIRRAQPELRKYCPSSFQLAAEKLLASLAGDKRAQAAIP